MDGCGCYVNINNLDQITPHWEEENQDMLVKSKYLIGTNLCGIKDTYRKKAP